MAGAGSGFESFEDKWLRAHPEQAIVAVFLPPAERRIAHAFGSLVHELELALFAAREPQPAAAKLAWWHDELAAAAAGAARHPITRELFDAAQQRAAAAPWAALVDGAMRQLDPAPAASLDAAFAALGLFYRPVAAIDTALRGMPGSAPDAAGDLWSASRLLRAAAAMHASAHAALVPLDLLARHDLTRAGLHDAGARRAALLADLLAALGTRIGSALAAAPDAGVGQRVRSRIDLRLAQRAARASDPALHLDAAGISRWHTLWVAWREAARRNRSVSSD